MMPTIDEIEKAAPNWSTEQAVQFLKDELGGENRKGALQAILDVHLAAILDDAQKPAPKAPAVPKAGKKAGDSLKLIGKIEAKDGIIVVGDSHQFDRVWGSRNPRQIAVYVTGSDEDLETLAQYSKRFKNVEVLEDGSWRIRAGNSTEAGATKTAIENSARTQNLYSVKAEGRSVASGRAMAEDACRAKPGVVRSGALSVAAKRVQPGEVRVYVDKAGRLVIG